MLFSGCQFAGVITRKIGFCIHAVLLTENDGVECADPVRVFQDMDWWLSRSGYTLVCPD